MKPNSKFFTTPPSIIEFKGSVIVEIDNIYKISYNKKEKRSITFSYCDGTKEDIIFDQLLVEPDEKICNIIANNIIWSKISRNRWKDNGILVSIKNLKEAEIPGVIEWH